MTIGVGRDRARWGRSRRRAGSPPSVRICLAFRFHANFYHSYRGDTPDEFGFGKDIRVIRRIIQILDGFNAAGVPVRGTWDIDNAFSLEEIMPGHCPDILESLERRVAEGRDEIQVMSYNNGLLVAHDAVEFDEAIGRALTNSTGSGVRDRFGTCASMVRPQEMMYTPLHLRLYRRHGIDSISLFYSAVPFNAFSNFVAPLPLEQRFNPLTLGYPGIAETLTLVPAYNHGDVADNLSLRWWLKRLRRRQMAMAEPKDLLLLLDADADDEYWVGYDVPLVGRLLAAARGLPGLIESVRDLDYVCFTTPGEYLKSHPPLGSLQLGQDTADGSFDGFSSWAEKWSNHRLWTGIERARILELQARRLASLPGGVHARREVEERLRESRESRLRALSTTHFGLSSPIVNRTRLRTASRWVGASVEQAAAAFDRVVRDTLAAGEPEARSPVVSLFDYVRGVSTAAVHYQAKPSRALVRLSLSGADPPELAVGLRNSRGEPHPVAVRRIDSPDGEAHTEMLLVAGLGAGGREDYRVERSGTAGEEPSVEGPASWRDGRLENGLITLRFDETLRPVGLAAAGRELADGPFLRSAIRYAGSLVRAGPWTQLEARVLGAGLVASVRMRSEILFEADGEKRIEIEREFVVAAGLPYVYLETEITYPTTHSPNYKAERARRLEQEYDANWREVMPCEIRPALFGSRERPLRIWKHNYLDHVSHYDLDYGRFSRNQELDSFNNHVTHAWVAVTDREKGLLVAQTAEANACFAFCPMRTRRAASGVRIFLNPFGSYHGRQWHYGTAFSGLGRWLAIRFSDTCDPQAPSYNGRSERFLQLIAPYAGDQPPASIQADAEAFAYPYAVVSNWERVHPPAYRAWSDGEADRVVGSGGLPG